MVHRKHYGGMTQAKNLKKNTKKKNLNIDLTKKRKNRQKSQSVSIMDKSVAIKSDWKGSGLDILFGLLYLKQKYKNVCIPLSSFFKTDLMWDTTIQYKCILKPKQKKAKHEDYNIYLPSESQIKDIKGEQFIDILRNCFKTYRFVIVPLFILWNECDLTDAHFNFIIMDNKNKTIERFDPFGVFKDDSYETLDWFDEDMDNFMKKNKFNFTYHKPMSYCPDYGFQQKEENNIEKGKGTEKSTDPGGYCGVWCIYYSELRLRYPDKNKDKLIQEVFKKLKTNPKNFRNFIRDYSNFILKQKNVVNNFIRKHCLKYIDNILEYKKCEKDFINRFIFKLFK